MFSLYQRAVLQNESPQHKYCGLIDWYRPTFEFALSNLLLRELNLVNYAASSHLGKGETISIQKAFITVRNTMCENTIVEISCSDYTMLYIQYWMAYDELAM